MIAPMTQAVSLKSGNDKAPPSDPRSSFTPLGRQLLEGRHGGRLDTDESLPIQWLRFVSARPENIRSGRFLRGDRKQSA